MKRSKKKTKAQIAPQRITKTPLPRRLKCAFRGCRAFFKPKRAWQKFHSSSCKIAAWEEKHPRIEITRRGGGRRWIPERRPQS